MKKRIYTACAALLLATTGCKDNPNVADNGPPAEPAPGVPVPSGTLVNCFTVSFDQTSEVDARPGGIWLGSLTDCADNVQHDYVIAMVSEDGRFRIMDANEHLLAGFLGTSGDLFWGNGIDFAPTGVEYFSGPTTNMFVDGTVDERARLQGRWGTEWGHYGYFTFEYVQQSYERATSLADLSGVWSMGTNYVNVPHAGIWTVEPDGRFDGQDDMGCLQSGQFSLINERYSVFAVELSVTGCSLAGTYTGLALYEDLVDWWDRSITVSVDDGTRAMRIGLAIERP